MALLAQYTIRGKQDYIFRTNAMREITGASALIRDAWDLLFREAEKAGVRTRKIDPAEESFPADPDDALAGGIGMADLFRGGGNDTVLIRDTETLRLVNAAFTHAILTQCPGMIPMCAAVTAGNDYPSDYRRLMEAAEREKNRMMPGRDLAMAPFSMFDRRTSQPIAHLQKVRSQLSQLTSEAWSKQEKAASDNRITRENAWLDHIAESENDRRLLAIVHADGNNMGIKIRKLLSGKTSYSECVPLMRAFTHSTAEAFTGKAKQALEKYAAGKSAEARQAGRKDEYIVRWIINDGDDATFVCNAQSALELTKVYLEAVSTSQGIPDGSGQPFRYSSCAGICICHSHYPFSTAYALAESACDNAKRKIHTAEDDGIREEAWIDWVYVRSGIMTDVEELRKAQRTDGRIARPWAAVCSNPQEIMTLSNLDTLADQMCVRCGITRTNIKSIGAAWEENPAEGRRELQRLIWRSPKLKEALSGYPDTETVMKAIYDLSEVYDLWYAQRPGEPKSGAEGGMEVNG